MNIELPKDAEGREIPLDTGTLYKKNGIEKYIYHYEFDPHDKYWVAETDDGPRNTSEFLLNQPDSWEQLEEDVDGCIEKSSICAYCTEEDCRTCAILSNDSRDCIPIVLEDIKKRIRKLRGEN